MGGIGTSVNRERSAARPGCGSGEGGGREGGEGEEEEESGEKKGVGPHSGE